MKTDIMISADGLSKQFGPVHALDKVSFDVHRGEVVGFLGPNGAGKSTAMRILTCYISPTTGSAQVHGFDIFDEMLEVRRHLGYLPQRAPLYQEMSVYDYLQFTAEVRGLDEARFKRRLEEVVDVCGLAETLGTVIGTLSHGYRQRVGLGQALIHDPEILILDEPTSDLDPNEKAEVLAYIKEVGKDRTVLLSTHNLAEVEEACARAIIISKGRVVADGPIAGIRARTGRVRYTLTVHEKSAEAGNKPPTATDVQQSLERLSGVSSVKELPTDETVHKFELSGPRDVDLRAELFRLAVSKGWTLLELRREAQSLDAVFRDLTKDDQLASRGRAIEDEDEDDDEADEDQDDEDEDDEDEDDEDEDEDEDDEDEDDDRRDSDAAKTERKE